MSLTRDDLAQIRQVVYEVVDEAVTTKVNYIVEEKLKPISGEIQALRNNVKELYGITTRLDKSTQTASIRLARLESTIIDNRGVTA